MTSTAQRNHTFDWFPMTPRDWFEGTEHMTLEQRGAYIDMICLQMLYEAPLPQEGDDYGWLAHKLRVSKQKTRKIVTYFVEEMKFRRTPEGLSNDRCEIELRRRQEIAAKRSDSARHRWEVAKGNKPGTSRKVGENPQEKRNFSPENPDLFGGKVEEKSTVSEKKSNEIKGSPMQVHGACMCDGPCVCDANARTVDIGHIESESAESPPDSLPPHLDVNVAALARRDTCPEKKQLKKVGGRYDYPASFELFMKAFPTTKGKDAAYGSWVKLDPDERVWAIWGAQRYAEQIKREVKKDPTTKVKWAQGWLTDRRWTDYVEETENRQEQAEARRWWEKPELVAQMPPERWREGIRRHVTNGRWPVEQMGPHPHSDRCVIPESIIREWRLREVYDRYGLRIEGAKGVWETSSEDEA